LIARGEDELWIIGANIPMAERDPELRAHAQNAGFLLAAPRDISSPQTLRRMARFEPDLILVATFSKKLKPELLAIPKLGAINVHASMLPKYRGALPEFWVIRNGEAQTGVTVHKMVDELDAGRVLAQVSLPILRDDDLLTLSQRIAAAGPPLVLEVLDRYRRGERPEGIEQELSQVTYAPMPKAADLEVRWTEPSLAIERLVRATIPMLDAFTFLRGEKLILRSVRAAPYYQNPLNPGELIYDAEHRLLFAGAGDHALALEEIELEDGIRLRGPSFSRLFGIPSNERVRFGKSA
jgi:methionyl-tRNA formyltransferase